LKVAFSDFICLVLSKFDTDYFYCFGLIYLVLLLGNYSWEYHHFKKYFFISSYHSKT